MDFLPLNKNRNFFLPRNRPFGQRVMTSEDKDRFQFHMLMVDDEEFILNAVRRGLEMTGIRVSGFRRGFEALKAFRLSPQDYDLALTDLNMPGMDGCQLADALLEIRQDIPIILSSGFQEKMITDKPLPIGIRHFITKPFRLPQLRTQIRRLVMKD